ncbi:MAG: tetratricopeptide repeat protein [Opitutus sp.]|nr:tetratricopeptide repeat protein [Opitutus sp.]
MNPMSATAPVPPSGADHTPPAGKRTRLGWIVFGVAGAMFALYFNALSVPFLFDDRPAIERNETIRTLWPLTTPLSPPVSGAGVAGRPIANLSLALNYALGGLEVRGYHAVNIGLHALTGLVLWGVLRRTLRRMGRGEAGERMAAAATLLWLVHPLQTESVVCVVQRNEVLVALFYLLTLYCFVRSTESTRRVGWTLPAVAACTLGMASKEVMATAPLLIFLYDRTFVAGSFRSAWRQRWRVHMALAGTWLLLGWLMLGHGQRAGTVGFGLGVGAWQYLLTQCGALTTYLKLAIWPSPLVVDYGVDVVHGLREVWGRGLVIVTLLGFTVFTLWRRPVPGFAAAAFFVVLAPSSSFVPLTTQPIAEHRMYLPLAAVIVLLVAGLHRLAPARRTFALAAGAAALALAGLTVRRNADYGSEKKLWVDTLAKQPRNARAQASLAGVFARAGQWGEALPRFEAALRLRPDYADTENDYAGALGRVGRLEQSIAHYEKARRLKPDDPDIRCNLGAALAQAGQTAAAMAQFEAALVANPKHPAALNHLGDALLKSGRTQEALARFESVIAIDPGHLAAHNNAGVALGALGRLRESIPHFEATLRGLPNSAQAHYNLAQALEGVGRLPEAVAHDEAALRISPDFAAARRHLQELRGR